MPDWFGIIAFTSPTVGSSRLSYAREATSAGGMRQRLLASGPGIGNDRGHQMATYPPLDPSKSPWKRGDVCTRGFEKPGFVLNQTSEYLEVRWSDDSIERIPSDDMDSILRVGHADSLGPDGRRTNVEFLQSLEALDSIQHGMADRIKTIRSDAEKKALDRLCRRIFSEKQCKWDARHEAQLMMLLTAPQNVGIIFRIRERIHRIFCSIE